MKISDSDQQKVNALLGQMEALLPGYSRMVIVLAAAKLIAAMLGPALPETTEKVLDDLPTDIRNMMARTEALMKKAREEN